MLEDFTPNRYSSFIIEGVDRLGKSSLIQNLLDEFGYHTVIHYEKPKKLRYYETDEHSVGDRGAPGQLELYQRASFHQGFSLLWKSNVIMDRFHLGEVVYSPRYRSYSGNYVFELEDNYKVCDLINVKLILLTTSNFDFIKDDGGSFDFSKKEEEQEDFKRAFNTSAFRKKSMIDVHDGKGGFKTHKQIFEEAVA